MTAPELSLVTDIVPMLSMELPLKVTALPEVPPLRTVRSPVPVMAPLTVKVPLVPLPERVRSLPFKSMSPLKADVTVVPLLAMAKFPTAPDPRLIGLVTVMPVDVVVVALPPSDEPRVIGIVDGPAAPLTVVALLTPAMRLPLLIVSPPVNVLAPERVSEVLLFCVTPVTLVPMTALRVTEPEPLPELVIVPV